MSYVLSPNMGLPVPVASSEAGPQFAIDINNCMSTLDAHTHAAGSGVQITPAAININTALSLNNNSLTSVAGVVLQAQGSTPANSTVYESGTDLYFVDGVGNNVRITQSGGIAGSPGSISNLTSPASAAYVAASKTFVWQSGSSIAANMDAASILMRNITPNSTNALTLQPPASLAANYSLTLPALPGSTSFLTLDTSGNISGSISTNAGIIGSNIALATIAKTNIVPVNQSITGSSGNFTTASTSYTNVTNCASTLNNSGRLCYVGIVSDGSGGNSRIGVETTSTGTFANATLRFLDATNNIELGDCLIGIANSSTNSVQVLTVPPSFYQYFIPASAAPVIVLQVKTAGASSTALVINVKLIVYEL